MVRSTSSLIGLEETSSRKECLVAYKSPISITGNISQDPELKQAGGSSKLSFSVACGHRYMKDGEWVEKTSFFNVVAWRQLADQAAPILEKGLGVVIQGRLEQRSYDDGDGNRRSMVEVVADDIAVNVFSLDGIVRRAPQGSAGAASKPSASKPTDDPW